MCGGEFRVVMVKLTHDKARDFAESPWFPWYLVAAYRLVLGVYCLGWTIYSGYYFRDDGPLWFIWLTNWGYLCVTVYFILAAVVTLWYHYKDKHQEVIALEMREASDTERNKNDEALDSDDEIPLKWHHKATWVIFNFTANNAILITCLYWGLQFRGFRGDSYDGIDFSTHLLNTVFVLSEVFLSSMPIHLLHIVYSWCFVVSYMIFSVIYWAAGGTNPVNGKPYIYSHLDFGSNPGLAIGLFCACLFVGGPLCQLILFGLYKLRQFVAGKCNRLD